MAPVEERRMYEVVQYRARRGRQRHAASLWLTFVLETHIIVS